MSERDEAMKINEMTGNFPVNGDNSSRFYSDPKRGIYSCWGVEAEGPDRKAVLPLTIGTKEHAEEGLKEWKKKTSKLQFHLRHLNPGDLYVVSTDWDRKIRLLPQAHGFDNIGNYAADRRKCEE